MASNLLLKIRSLSISLEPSTVESDFTLTRV
jgi:hypothetical protein